MIEHGRTRNAHDADASLVHPCSIIGPAAFAAGVGRSDLRNRNQRFFKSSEDGVIAVQTKSV